MFNNPFHNPFAGPVYRSLFFSQTVPAIILWLIIALLVWSVLDWLVF